MVDGGPVSAPAEALPLTFGRIDLSAAWALAERNWRNVIIAIAAVALLVRLGFVAATGSHADANLQVYYYFSDLFRHGIDPYHAPLGGAIDPKYAVNPPALHALFAGLLAIHDSAVTLRVFFALADAAVILAVGLLLPRERSFRLAFVLFYAFNPLVLLMWTVSAQDKTFTFLLIVLVVAGLARADHALTWVSATVLAAVKWMSLFFVVPLATHALRERSRRSALQAVGIFVLIFALSNLPFFPSNLRAFHNRGIAAGWSTPIHESITRVLAMVHLYTPLIPKIGGPVLILAVWVLHQARRITIAEAVALSIFASYVLLTDESTDRIVLISLTLILVMATTAKRWAIWWAISSFAAIGAYNGYAGRTASTSRFPKLPHAVVSIVGDHGLHDLLVQNAIMICVAGLFLADRLRGAPRPASEIHPATSSRSPQTPS